MARRMILLNEGGEVMLSEVDAENEAQLQERLKDSPGLFPVEEFGLPDPLMVVGRETSLPSGAADLLALAPTGDILVVEMKTGPQNSDFRAALAQATDYGADLWQMTPDVFDATVAARYFASAHCGPSYKGITSIAQAAKTAWPEMTDEQRAAFHDRFASVLASGAFNFVIVAQRFTEPMMATANYLNAISAGRARYFLVELVRFTSADYSAFEARTILKPAGQAPKASAPSINETTFLEAIADTAYREALERLFDGSHGLGLRFEWGARGPSIRVLTPHRTEPISVAWVYPPGVSGWMGLRDVTFGYDRTQTKAAEPAQPAFTDYELAISQIVGAQKSTVKDLVAHSFKPTAFTNALDEIIEAIARLIQEVTGK